MQATGRLNDSAHLTWLEGKRGLFEFLLHVAAAEIAQVAAFAGRGAVGLGGRKVAEVNGSRLDFCLVSLDDFQSLVLGTSDF